jgi:hypothetical protein
MPYTYGATQTVMEESAIQPMIWYFMTPLRLYPVEVATPGGATLDDR